MLSKYLDDYYRNKIKTGELGHIIGVNPVMMSNYFKKNGLLTFNKHLDRLNFNNKKLREILVKKYNSIYNRCNGLSSDHYGHYDGIYYLSIIEWVDFCNYNKLKLEKMWENYINNNKNLKYAISIDRIDDTKGYYPNNIQFVTHGFNSWKRSLNRPIKTRYKNNDWKYFMSCREGCRYYGIREKYFGEILNGITKSNDYTIKITSIEDVLQNNNCKTLKEYYEVFIQ